MNKIKIIFLLLQLISFKSTFGQYYDFGFRRNDSVTYSNISGISIDFPWLGGLNSCQFFEIDLDQNGTNDLVIFDKHGSRILPFIKYNSCGLQRYFFSPEYRELFPKFKSWVQSRDFNFDDKLDLFTYTTAGIKVYKNVSDFDNLLFEIHTPRINSDYGSGIPVNLFCNSEDYPAIADIDYDGDLDVLNFWTLGKYIDYHKNRTIENYSHFDSLVFSLETRCWGHFSEHETSNILFLNDDCSDKQQMRNAKRHVGSTLLAYDFFGNELMDLLIGDVDYPHLILLRNGGTTDSAFIVSQDTLFPCQQNPVRLYSMPVASLIDVNFDNRVDLLVSPFDPTLNKAENIQSVWVYHNQGTNQIPQFALAGKSFMQEKTIDLGSAAYPLIVDINNNGAKDLIVGNWGVYDSSKYIGTILHSYYSSSISYIKNVGSSNFPIFEHINEDIGQLRQYGFTGLFPTGGDINNDGDVDLIIGQSDGTLIFLENIAGYGQEPTFALPQFIYQQIDVGKYSAPVLFDLNKDGKLDLIIGNQLGKLSYYQNVGSLQNPVFNFVTNQLGSVDVRDYNASYFGYSTPSFYIKNDTTHLFVGSEGGNIFHFKDIDNNIEGTFSLVLSELIFVRNNKQFPINEGIRTAVAVADFNADNLPEILIGNWAGGLSYYSGTTPPIIHTEISKNEMVNSEISIYPNPAINYFSIDVNTSQKIQQIIITDISGRIIKINNENNKSINLTDIKSGLYLIKVIFTSGEIVNQKLIKQ